MNKPRYILIFIALIFTVCACFPCNLSADTTLDSDTLDLVSNTVFEVVVAKPTTDSLSYEYPLPLNLIPYAIRNDKYYPIGTAFAISPTEFISAAHVMNLGYESQFKEVCLRDKDGKVYSIDKIVKYSERRDFVVLSLKDKTAKEFFKVNTKPQINQKVFAVGNALGEGIVIRDGLYTSDTPEEEEGEWKWIRFSAAASPGNSGGPLLDKDGKVIGIVLGKSPNENLNYALPITEAINAKANAAIAHKKMKYFLDNLRAAKLETIKNTIPLPKSYQELNRELIEGTNLFSYNIIKALFTENKGNIFPNGRGSNIVLYSTYDTVFPNLIMQAEDGNWYASYPKEIKEAELTNNGHISHGNIGDTLFLHIQKPDDIPLAKFYNNSNLFMDLILKGIRLTRQIGTEQIKITSMGKASEDHIFTDSYGRKWQVRTYLLEYSDEKVVTFSLLVPGGCITMMRAGQTGLIDNGHIPDLKILTNFIYISYYGTLKHWQEFLNMKEFLPAVFSSINISFDYNRAFQYKSKRLSFSCTPDDMTISENSHVKLMFGYFKENGKTVWDAATISIGEDKSNKTYFGISRNMMPAKELGDKYQSNWDIIAKQKFPFNDSAYYEGKATTIATVIKKPDDTPTPVLYTAAYGKDGKVEQKEMETMLGKFIRNLTVYEYRPGVDTAYDYGVNTYHDKGNYYQALWDYERIKDYNPKTAYGHILRGDVYKDKGDFESALRDYNKAVEINPQNARVYFNRGLAYHDRKEIDRALSDYNKALEIDPMAAEAYNKRGSAYSDKGDFQHAFLDLNKALEINPNYAKAYNSRGIAYGKKGEHDRAISDFNKALEIDPNDAEVYNNRGFTYKLKGELDPAISDFSHAIEIKPDFALAYINRGNTYAVKKDRNNSCSDWKQACTFGACENYMRAKKTGYCE